MILSEENGLGRQRLPVSVFFRPRIRDRWEGVALKGLQESVPYDRHLIDRGEASRLSVAECRFHQADPSHFPDVTVGPGIGKLQEFVSLLSGREQEFVDK